MSKIAFSSKTDLHNPDNFLCFALYDSSADTVVLESKTPSKPYAVPLQVMFDYNAISGHNYIIVVWESADGSASGEERNRWAGTVSGVTFNIKATEYLKVGNTPGLVADADTYNDTSWAGWNYKLERNSQTYIPDNISHPAPHYHQIDTGGMQLLGGRKFVADEDFCVQFEPQVIPGDPGTPSNPFGSGRIITTNESLTNADVNQALFIQSATDEIVIKLPTISTVTDYQFLNFFSEGGSQINVVLQCDTGNKIFWRGNRDAIALGRSESLQLFKAPTGPSGAARWNIYGDFVGGKQVGEIIFSYANDGENTLSLAGQILSRSKYPRLWEWVQGLAGGVIAESSWANSTTVDGVTVYPNKGFFSNGNGSTTFRMPLITDIQLRAVGGAPGVYEHWQSVEHDHSTKHAGSGSGGGLGYVGGSSPFTDNDNNTGPMKVTGSGTSTLLTAVGSKVKTETIGAYALIRI